MNPLTHARERRRRLRALRHWRFVAPALGGALVPKCLLCAVAYTAGGAALLGPRPELCGDAAGSGPATFFAPLAGAILGASFTVWRHLQRPRGLPPGRTLD